MAICPFLSHKAIGVDVADRTVYGDVYDNSGVKIASGPSWSGFPGWTINTEEVIYLPENIKVDSTSDVIVYQTGAGGNGQFDSNGFFRCYQSTSCQLWDPINLRCGTNSTPLVTPPPTPSSAGPLISEFMSNEDLDGGKGPGTSIFGTDFMITDDGTCPPMLIGIYSHPDWSDPPVSVTWATYLSW